MPTFKYYKRIWINERNGLMLTNSKIYFFILSLAHTFVGSHHHTDLSFQASNYYTLQDYLYNC